MTGPGSLSSGGDQLSESLWQDARREAEGNLQRARAEALKLVEGAEAFLERQLELVSEKAREETTPMVARILNKARGEAEKVTLEARYALLEKCYEEAGRMVAEDSAILASVRSCLDSTLRQAVAGLDTPGDTLILVNPDDVDTSRSILQEMGLDIRVDGLEEILGGVLVRIDGGSRLIDNTVTGRLGALREAPPVRILSLLNPDAVDGLGAGEKPAGEGP
ncbi:MAG: V-type ATP synthase subunit E [bacterium]|nr:V-type ATP synthase subunit E [bacterium]MDT8396035.1 V-type ATP synthase subunit E [bacterium]